MHWPSVHGRMATTEHSKILSILEHQAHQFCLKIRLVPEHGALAHHVDEMGTLLNFEAKQELRERESQARMFEEVELQQVQDEVLEVHGVTPGKKPEGVICLLYKNMNGLDGRFSNNQKVEKAKEIHDDLEADLVAYDKHCLNLKHKSAKLGSTNCSG